MNAITCTTDPNIQGYLDAYAQDGEPRSHDPEYLAGWERAEHDLAHDGQPANGGLRLATIRGVTLPDGRALGDAIGESLWVREMMDA